MRKGGAMEVWFGPKRPSKGRRFGFVQEKPLRISRKLVPRCSFQAHPDMTGQPKERCGIKL